jgi:hypothetical protein
MISADNVVGVSGKKTNKNNMLQFKSNSTNQAVGGSNPSGRAKFSLIINKLHHISTKPI